MTEATSKALDTIPRLALCGQSCYEECLFNPDGVCLRPLLKLKPAVVTDDVCDSFISNAPGSIGAIGNVFCGSKNSAEAETSDPEPSVRQAAMMLKQVSHLYCAAMIKTHLCGNCDSCQIYALQCNMGEHEKAYLGAITDLDGNDRQEFQSASEFEDAVAQIAGDNSKVVEIYRFASGFHHPGMSWIETVTPPVLVRYVTDPRGKTM